jgi:hypothetical protein
VIVICIARKPLVSSTLSSVRTHGCGCLNVDATRIHSGPSSGGSISGATALGQGSGWNAHANVTTAIDRTMERGRWPSNVVLTSPVAIALDAAVGVLVSGRPVGKRNSAKGYGGNIAVGSDLTGFGDSGGASRFFKVLDDQ